MKTKQKRARTRAARLAERERQLAKQQADVEELQEEETIPDEVIPDEPESIEKEMGEYYAGPTSWEEMDAMKQAREQAEHVREATWNTQDLVYNILGHPMMAPKEKADAMKKVADGFGERVSGMMAEHEKMMKKDLDVLLIESILAADKRRTGPLETFKDWITKAVLSGDARESLSDDQFALVHMVDGKKVRKYPIHDKAHVRNALARAAQQNDADAHAAMPKIRAAAKKMGIEMAEKSLIIEKDMNGDWRYVGTPTNNFIDFDSDIISKEAHAEYAEWWETHKDFSPVFTTWHLPGMVRKNAADLVMEHEGFLIVSGKLTEEETEQLLKASLVTDIGMSHQSFALARDPNDKRVITKYRMYEYSDLPLENAANPFTDNFEFLVKEADMDKAKYLAQFMDGDLDKANKFLETIGLKKETLEQAGIENKEKAEDAVAPATPETPAKEPPTKETPAPVDQKALVEAVIKELGAEDLSKAIAMLQEAAEKVPVLEALVKEMQGSQEEKIAEMLTPPASRFSWMQKARASESDDNVADEEEEPKLKSKAPGVPEGYWLSEVTGTSPVQVQ